MKIPYKFELMGKTIVVRFVTELLQESDALGQACYRTGEIKILDNSPTYKITEDQQFSQWGSCHEKCFDGLMGSLKIELCPTCHSWVHASEAADERLKMKYQRVYEQTHTRAQWMKLMGRNWL